MTLIVGTIQQHNGCIAVDSRIGHGTTFSLFFPALITDDASARAGTAPIPMGQGETILLVEDEQLVLEVTQDILASLNYKVLTAMNGEEALTIYRSHADQIALVMTDVVMPKVDGFGLAAALQAEAPEMKVLMLSGYAGEAEVATETYPNIVARLPKPVGVQELAQALLEAI